MLLGLCVPAGSIASFESANLGGVTQITPCEYELRLRADTNNERHRLWFYFAVAGGARRGQRVLLSVTNFSKGKSLYRDGMSPLVRSLPSRPKWERVAPANVFYYRSPRHRGGYVLSWLFQFDVASPERYACPISLSASGGGVRPVTATERPNAPQHGEWASA